MEKQDDDEEQEEEVGYISSEPEWMAILSKIVEKRPELMDRLEISIKA